MERYVMGNNVIINNAIPAAAQRVSQATVGAAFAGSLGSVSASVASTVALTAIMSISSLVSKTGNSKASAGGLKPAGLPGSYYQTATPNAVRGKNT
jgi:hypothetical protein